MFAFEFAATKGEKGKFLPRTASDQLIAKNNGTAPFLSMGKLDVVRWGV